MKSIRTLAPAALAAVALVVLLASGTPRAAAGASLLGVHSEKAVAGSRPHGAVVLGSDGRRAGRYSRRWGG